MNLIWPVKGKWKITAGFDERRPLSLPPEKRWHKHGAVDIGAKAGTLLVAPEDGLLFFYKALRPCERVVWRRGEEPVLRRFEYTAFPFSNYFYDIYGAVVVLITENRVHVFCHSYWHQLFVKFNSEQFENKLSWNYQEQIKDARFVVEATYSRLPIPTSAGDPIGYVGSAGFSTGPHVHWEIHPSYKFHTYEKRIDPAELFPKQFKRKESHFDC